MLLRVFLDERTREGVVLKCVLERIVDSVEIADGKGTLFCITARAAVGLEADFMFSVGVRCLE